MTRDGSLSAHFEHTVAVTAGEPWILTAREVPATGAAASRSRCIEQLPSGLYRVRLDEGAERGRRTSRTGSSRNFIRVLVGDRVRVELSPVDHRRGRIVEKVG